MREPCRMKELIGWGSRTAKRGAPLINAFPQEKQGFEVSAWNNRGTEAVGAI